MTPKILLLITVIIVIFTYVGIIFYAIDCRDNAQCNDIITLTDGTIINCKRFSVLEEVLSYRDCNNNAVIVPLVNIKSMRRIDDED